MIMIHKHPLPNEVTITREEDYRSGIVFQMLVEDFHDKCYICEDSVHTAPNVDHRISHGGNIKLKYDWNNLYLSCSHCNNTKSNKYDGIIDPTKIDPEKVIKLSLTVDDELRETVIVQKIDGNGDVDITVNLLNAVYNGINTDMKKYASQQLKNKLSNELSWFRMKIEKYKTDKSESNKAVIAQALTDNSVFAAFKRGMVRDDPDIVKAICV